MAAAAQKIKIPPYSVASEKIVVATMLGEPELIEEVVAIIPDGEAFFRPEYGRLFDAIAAAGTGASPGAPDASDGLVARIVKTAAPDDRDSTRAELIELRAGAASPTAALAHARTVVEKANMRGLIAAVTGIIHDSYYSDASYDAQLERARSRLADL